MLKKKKVLKDICIFIWVMLGSYKIAQLLPQIVMWRVVSGRDVSPHGSTTTSLPFITHHMASCGKSCATICGPSISLFIYQTIFAFLSR